MCLDFLLKFEFISTKKFVIVEETLFAFGTCTMEVKKEVLVRRGCAVPPPSTRIPPSVAHLKMTSSSSKPGDPLQCDSGFGDDEEIRKFEKQEAELDKIEEQKRDIKTLAERTQDLRIDSTDEADAVTNRQPCSDKTDGTQFGGHFMNYAESSDPRYLLAPVREQLFGQDDDGDT